MKATLKRLEKAIEIANAADEKWENNPESADAEKEWNDAYKVEHEIRRELATAIVNLTNEVDFDTAFKMTYNPKTAELINAMRG